MLVKKFYYYEFRIIGGWEMMRDMAFVRAFNGHSGFCLIRRRFGLVRLAARYAIRILLGLIVLSAIMGC